MKKVITMAAVVAVAGMAVADLAYFQVEAPSLADQGGAVFPGGTLIAEGAAVVAGDITGLVENDQINISAFADVVYGADFAVQQPFLGGKAFTLINERPADTFGTVTLAVDINGGGVALGDYVALTTITINDMAAAGDPAPTNPEVISVGALTANVQVVPEPATIGLMGIAGLGMYLARRKVRR